MDKQTILSAMETDVQTSLNAFNAAVAELTNATYIIMSGKLSKLLQSIAVSRPLYELFAAETQGYNFAEDFRSRQFRDENGRPYIDVPQDPAEQIRFAVCLLYAVDTGKLNIEHLLHTFYTDTDANTELRAFFAAVLQPFAQNVNAALTGVPIKQTQSEEAQEPLDAQVAATAAPTEPSPSDSLLDTIGNVVGEIVGIVAQNATLTPDEREELLLVCDAFNTAVGLKEFNSMRVMYISLKNTLSHCAIFSELEEKYNALNYLMQGLGL